MKDPGQFDRFARRNCEQKHDGKCIDVIYGIKEGGKTEIQALRYDKKIWTASAAKSHCDSRDGSFEAASGKEEFRMTRLYSTWEIKALDEEQRTIEGIATTPAPDRVDDVVEQEGIEYELPLPLLYQHNSRMPIGTITEAKIGKDGMKIKAQVAKSGVAEFIDEAWRLIKAKLVRGLSIGFRSLEESYDKERHAFNYKRIELLEISAVTIPANAEATILSVKSASENALAAFGHEKASDPIRIPKYVKLPGVPGLTGPNIYRGNMKTLAEQIASFEAKRQANMARMNEIMSKSGEEGRTLDEKENEEYSGLQSEVEQIDDHLVKMRKHEKLLVETATPVTAKNAGDSQAAAAVRGNIITVKSPQLPLGTAFSRYAMALMATKGDRKEALEAVTGNRIWKDTTPQVERALRIPDQIMKAAVAAGTTTTVGWAAELADYTYMAAEFIEFLRPMTIIGRIPNLRRVPFNIKIPLQSAGSSAAWVGEAARKPVGSLTFSTLEFRFFKAAGIVVLTDELVRFSNPSAEALVRQDLADTIVRFLDEQFIDPTVAGSANVSPASVLNGAGTAAASGTTADDFRADFKAAMAVFTAANINVNGLVFVMEPSLAVSMSLMRNALGQKEFPDINAGGGSLEGYLVVTSNSASSGIVAIMQPSEILLADDGGIQLDASREASLVMDDGGSPAVTTMTSLWQNNLVGLRVERIINWARRRTAACYYISSCDYGAGSPA